MPTCVTALEEELLLYDLLFLELALLLLLE